MSFLRLAGHCRKFSRSAVVPSQVVPFQQKIGKREVVGFGISGHVSYVDSAVFPYPAIRFREITPDIEVLKEKEKASWKRLSFADKKALYRATFRQTIAEIRAPDGQWKQILGGALFMISLALWFHLLITYLTYEEYPETFKLENRQAQYQRMIDLRINPITGLTANIDPNKNSQSNSKETSEN